MKANELRIGNIIESRTKHPIIVNWGTLKALENGEKTYFPIPLTEEWLLKFGFEWKNFAMRNGRISIRESDGKYNLHLTNEAASTITIQIKYVHQLQNLYFALTGEELTISY